MKDNGSVKDEELIAKTTGVVYAGQCTSIINHMHNPYLSIPGGTDTVTRMSYHWNVTENAAIDCIRTSYIFLGDGSLSRSSTPCPRRD